MMNDRMSGRRNSWGMKVVGVWLLWALVMLLIPRGVDAQGLTYSKGQTMHPAFEGWEQKPDGSINLLFGYLNRNWEEELDKGCIQAGDWIGHGPTPGSDCGVRLLRGGDRH